MCSHDQKLDRTIVQQRDLFETTGRTAVTSETIKADDLWVEQQTRPHKTPAHIPREKHAGIWAHNRLRLMSNVNQSTHDHYVVFQTTMTPPSHAVVFHELCSLDNTMSTLGFHDLSWSCMNPLKLGNLIHSVSLFSSVDNKLCQTCVFTTTLKHHHQE